jgi:hypothetical protein
MSSAMGEVDLGCRGVYWNQIMKGLIRPREERVQEDQRVNMISGAISNPRYYHPAVGVPYKNDIGQSLPSQHIDDVGDVRR